MSKNLTPPIVFSTLSFKKNLSLWILVNHSFGKKLAPAWLHGIYFALQQ